LVSCALYSFDNEIFNALEKLKKSERNEYELTDAIKSLLIKNNIYCVKSLSCFQISYPWDLLNADKELRRNKNVIGKNSKIDGNIENSSVGNNCIIDGNIINSIIMDNTTIDKGSIVQDSIIGGNVYFKGSIIAKNNVYSIVKGKKIKVDRLGAIIADDVKAKNVIISAGCKIWPNKTVKGEINHDVK